MSEFFNLENVKIIAITALCIGVISLIIFSINEKSVFLCLGLFFLVKSVFCFGLSTCIQNDLEHFDIIINGSIYHCESYYTHNEEFILNLLDGTELRFYNPTDVVIKSIEVCECDNQ